MDAPGHTPQPGRTPHLGLTREAGTREAGTRDAGTPAPATKPGWAGRARLIVPLVLALLVGAGFGAVLFQKERPAATMLGASGAVEGGLIRINGILPLEADGWLPPEAAPALEAPVPEGAHRVRVLLELTALDREGLDFRAGDYGVEYLGSQRQEALWASVASTDLQQGGTLVATMVFEIPDRAVEMVLDGPGSTRLSLGTEHHSGTR
ncbi:hypothetical protein NCCP1664_27480 [Zafaria cholistanensis]|uniref:DUF4352 domain-containing protein n=1 Tax=Zafaria cholistanensis TaxID=1682741 RepID=A0A5A7NTY8_9MICC|nr:hypothetical protein [Zafaria cholistanensis]GER24253.1 hypothetical protein NCCP1664_27480 [Zafaria cholistanensis]